MYCLTEEMEEAFSEDESFANLEFLDMLSELPEKDRILFVLHYGEGRRTIMLLTGLAVM